MPGHPQLLPGQPCAGRISFCMVDPRSVDDDFIGKAEKHVHVTLKSVALFDCKRRTTEHEAEDSGCVSAWYLDEDYGGDCFVDCQMFFDFKKTPNIQAALKAEVDPEEFTLTLASEPFPVRGYK